MTPDADAGADGGDAGRTGAAAGTGPPSPRGPREYPMTLHGLAEPRPGPRWRALFEATWPAYRRWYLSEGLAARPSLDEAAGMLRRHLPALYGGWQTLVRLAGDDELAARMLTGYDPPAFRPGCTQAIARTSEGPVLVRNYDYGPALFEQVVTSTSFTADGAPGATASPGRRVIGTSDCLWGLLDGMNDAGLVVSLAYGGTPGTGHGFGIPLVVRHLLQSCTSVREARAELGRLPVSATYNLAVLDATGEHVTAFVAPGYPPEFSRAPVTANHHLGRLDHPAYAASIRSVERQEAATASLGAAVPAGLHPDHGSRPDTESIVQAFLRPPLRSTAYGAAFGTLYTAVYRPNRPGVEYVWPGSRWVRTLDSPTSTHHVTLVEETRT